MIRPALILAVLSLAACETSAPPPVAIGTTKTVYRCEGGRSLQVTFANHGESAVMMRPQGAVPMRRIVSASGARYSAIVNGRYELDTKGNQATLYDQGRVVLGNCVAG